MKRIIDGKANATLKDLKSFIGQEYNGTISWESYQECPDQFVHDW